MLRDLCSLAVAGDEDGNPPVPPTPLHSTPSSNVRSVSTVAHPVAAKAPERIAALGSVLDATSLIADEGELDGAAAQEHAASAELARLTGSVQGWGGHVAQDARDGAGRGDQGTCRGRRGRGALRAALGSACDGIADARRQKQLDAVTSGPQRPGAGGSAGTSLRGHVAVERAARRRRRRGPRPRARAAARSSASRRARAFCSRSIIHRSASPPARVSRCRSTTASAPECCCRASAILYDENGAYVYKQLAARRRPRKRPATCP